MLWKIRKRSIRKRPFLLFELLLAMGLLLLCLFPMIKTHVGIAKEEKKAIEAIRQELQIQEALCSLKIDLHKHIYSWEELIKGVKNERYLLNKLKKSTKNNTNESAMVLGATLLIGEKEIERRIYVEKKADRPR
ncbi:MAG: hypothetical protein JJU12_02770 [Chlamydiales bacterium]|nr:hypothetical protein [Chlamydiales bacterium]